MSDARRFQIGAAIRRLRTERGLNLEDAADEAEITTSRLQRMEVEDDNFNKWLTDAEKVADVLGTSVELLITRGRVA